MNSISILIVVDCLGAEAAGTLMGNVYMVDTNKFIGSWNEGTDTLHTVARDGQMLTWRVQPVSIATSVSIAGYSGDMVNDRICMPAEQRGAGDPSWQGHVQTKGSVGSWIYTVTLSIDGAQMSFSPYLKVV
jgi:hypothetical protein